MPSIPPTLYPEATDCPTLQFVKVPSNVAPSVLFDLLLAEWHLPTPNLVVSLVGEERSFAMKSWLRDVLRKGLVKAAQSTGEAPLGPQDPAMPPGEWSTRPLTLELPAVGAAPREAVGVAEVPQEVQAHPTGLGQTPLGAVALSAPVPAVAPLSSPPPSGQHLAGGSWSQNPSTGLVLGRPSQQEGQGGTWGFPAPSLQQ